MARGKSIKGEKVQVVIQIPIDLHNLLKEAAEQEGMGVTDIMRKRLYESFGIDPFNTEPKSEITDAKQIVDLIIAYASSQLKRIEKNDPQREIQLKRLSDEIHRMIKN